MSTRITYSSGERSHANLSATDLDHAFGTPSGCLAQEAEYKAGQQSLEAAQRFESGLALGLPALEVGAGAWVPAALDDGQLVQRGVELPISVAVEAVASLLTGGGIEWRDAGEARELRVGAKSADPGGLKPIFEENGSGMHVHQSLWKDGETLMHSADGYGLLSPLALHYAAGLLEHAPALMAFCAPATNSYRRLVPGYEAPVLLKHSQRNRSAAVRIPMYSASPNAKRLEFRPPDPLANPYLTFPAMLMAGLDGIERELDPGEPIDLNLYELPAEELADIPTVPTTLDEALDALEADHAFLTRGGVFTDDLIATYIEFRREQSDRVKIRPHPYEFPMYFDG